MNALPARHRLFLIALLVMTLLASACSSRPARDAAPAGATFIVVRHAEKATDDPDNPSLSPAGEARAAALAAQVSDTRIAAVYATEFKRTRQTAQPTADAHGAPVSAYYAKGKATESATRWKQQHPTGTVLVVGHSNTVPDLVAALCQCATKPMDETEYDRLSIVHVDASGNATLEVRTYGAPAR